MTQIPIEADLLRKIAKFIALSAREAKSSQIKLASYQEKEAMEKVRSKNYRRAIEKVADVLYETDFITDYDEKEDFVKTATLNPLHVVHTLEKVCNAADVSLVGKPARVTAKTASTSDPIYNRVFGHSSNFDLDED